MSSDRFIAWFEKKPTKKTIQEHLAEFLGTGFDLSWNEDRWLISIPGEPAELVASYPTPYRKQRFIEVIMMKQTCLGNLDVLTRQADPLVSAIADGLVRFLCFRLNGGSTD